MIKRRERTRKRTRRIVFAALAAGSAALATLLSYQYGFWGRANHQVDQTAPRRTAPLVNAREGPPERERPTPELLPLPGDRGPTAPEAQAKHLPQSGSLPPLDRSDALVRELALSISSRPELVTWLASDELIRRFATSVDNVADGLSPRMHVPALAPKEPFRIIRRDGRLFIDPASYRRYDAIADVFSSLPTSSCAELYARLGPLIESAFSDLGYPPEIFRERTEAAIREILTTPSVRGDTEVELKVITYAFRDPALEGLSPVQKHLLRMGPRNARRIVAKVREIALAIGVPRDQLPSAQIYRADRG
jgi:hypothetical protein